VEIQLLLDFGSVLCLTCNSHLAVHIHCRVPNYLESPTKQVEQEFQRYFEAFRIVLLTEVFVTSNGYLGRGQPGVTNDGEVSIVFDTTTLFVLRKYGESRHDTGKRSMVGDCYVHGLMNGEGVSMAAQNVELFRVPVSVLPANCICAFQDALYES
jgi:hypothetical protein